MVSEKVRLRKEYFLIFFLFLFFCELPQYPAPKTEGIIEAESQFGIYDKYGVYYDSCGNNITLSIKVTSMHRVDSTFLKMKIEGKEENIILTSFYRGQPIDTVNKDRTWLWDTNLVFWCPQVVWTELEMYLDNGEVRKDTLKMVIKNRGKNLRDLIFEGTEISPSFNGNVYEYTGIVENEVASINIKPYIEGECAVITINKDTVLSGIGKEYSLLVGENSFEIKSIMLEGLEKTYRVNIIRRESRGESALRSIKINGILLPDFDSTRENYSLEVENNVQEIVITCESKNEKAMIKIDTGDSAIGLQTVTKKLFVGTNELRVNVVSEDGSNIKEYVINIIRKAATKPKLKKIEASVGVLQPEFNSDTFNYKLLVQEKDTNILLSVECEDIKSRVKIDGEEIKQKTIGFNKDSSSVFIEVISWDSSSISEYKIFLERIKNNDAGLASITFSNGVFTPEFNPEITKYRLSLKSSDTNVILKVEPRHNRSVVTINGEEVKEKLITVSKDTDSVLIKVISEDKSNVKDYIVVIEKVKSNNALLRELILTPTGMLNPSTFDPDLKEYSLTVADSVETLIVRAIPAGSGAIVKINNMSSPAKIFLQAGVITPVNIVVKAEDGITTETYRLLVTRSTSDIAILTGVILSEGELIPSFNSEITSYVIAVSSKTESIKIKPIRAHSRSIVTVNQNTVPYDSFSLAIPVSTGQATQIEVVVTSESGKEKRSYLFVARKRFLVNILSSSSDSGNVDPSGLQKIYDGDSLKITANSASGYNFLKWIKISGNCVFTDSSKSITYLKAVDDATVKAVFELKKYQLSVTCDQNMGNVSGGGTIEHGKSVTITATPKSGYHFVKWTVSEGKANIGDSTKFSTTVTLTNGNAKITALFAINKYLLTVLSDGNGNVIGSDSVVHNSSKQIKATPKDGYRFVKWVVEKGEAVIEDPTKNETTVKITSDATVKVIFEVIKYGTLTLKYEGSGSVNGGGKFIADSFITISAIASKDYIFLRWEIEEGKDKIFIEDISKSTTRVKLSEGNIILKAIFRKPVLIIKKDGILLEPSSYEINVGFDVHFPQPPQKENDSCFYFTGDTNSYLEVYHDEISDLSNKNFVISMRIKPDTTGIPIPLPGRLRWFGIIAKGLAEKEQFAFDIQQGSSNDWCYRYWVRDTSCHVSSLIKTCNFDTNWHDVKLTREKYELRDTISFYLDNSLIRREGISSPLYNTPQKSISIGNRKDSYGDYTYGFKGYISNVKIEIFSE